MKFIVSTTALLKSLQTVIGAIDSNTILPVLADFLFDINKTNLKISATNLETTMITEVKIDSKEVCQIAIPAKVLMDTLKTLPEQPLTFKVDEKTFGIEVLTEKGRYKLSGEDPTSFPKTPLAENISETSIPASELSYAVNKTLFAVSGDDLRPSMTGVLFQFSPEGTTFVSTDAHKLVKLSKLNMKSEKQSRFIVPKKALGLLKGALTMDSNPDVSISYNASNAFFNIGNTKLICRLIDAQYPDYNAVIPQNNPNTLTINRPEFLNALRRISIYSNKITYQVVLTITADGKLQLSAQDLDFNSEAKETLSCQYKGEDMEIAFNARILIEMLGVLDAMDIEIELSTPSRAGIIRESDKKENEDLMMLVMPVMMNA